MTTEEQAADIYQAVKDLPGIAATVQAKIEEIGLKLLNGTDRFETTSFSLNGQSATGTVTATLPELLRILRLVDWMLTNSAVLPSTQRTVPSFSWL